MAFTLISGGGYRSEIPAFYTAYDAAKASEGWQECADFDTSTPGRAFFSVHVATAVNIDSVKLKTTIDGASAVEHDFLADMTSHIEATVVSTCWSNNPAGYKIDSMGMIEFQSAFKFEASQWSGGADVLASGAVLFHASEEYARIIFAADEALIGPDGNPIRAYTYPVPCMAIFWRHGVDGFGNPIAPSNAICFLNSRSFNWKRSSAGIITGGYIDQGFNDTVGGPKHARIPIVDASMDGEVEVEFEETEKLGKPLRKQIVTIQNGSIVEEIYDDYELTGWQFRDRFSPAKERAIENAMPTNADVRVFFGRIKDQVTQYGYFDLRHPAYELGLQKFVDSGYIDLVQKADLLRPKSEFTQDMVV